ncbi:unnamed protein product [Dicrocoelium dendriticum]|nr:unnamed protein product [Dicrocoelium dendriticum]
MFFTTYFRLFSHLSFLQFSSYPIPIQGPTDTCYPTSISHDISNSVLSAHRIEEHDPCFPSISHVCPVTVQTAATPSPSVVASSLTSLTHPPTTQSFPSVTKPPSTQCGALQTPSRRTSMAPSSIRYTGITATGHSPVPPSLTVATSAFPGSTGLTHNSVAMLPAPRRRRPFGHVMSKNTPNISTSSSSLLSPCTSDPEFTTQGSHVSTVLRGSVNEASAGISPSISLSAVAAPTYIQPGNSESTCASSLPFCSTLPPGSESPPNNASAPNAINVCTLSPSAGSQNLAMATFSECSLKETDTNVVSNINSSVLTAKFDPRPAAPLLDHDTALPVVSSSSFSTGPVSANLCSSVSDIPSAIHRMAHSTKFSPSARPQLCHLSNGCSGSADLHTTLERLAFTCSTAHSDFVEFHHDTSSPLEATGLFPVNRKNQSSFGTAVPQVPPALLHRGPDEHRILTHVVDGYVIYESNKPFPVKNGMAVVEAALLQQCLHEETVLHSVSPSKNGISSHVENHATDDPESEHLEEGDIEKIVEDRIDAVSSSYSHCAAVTEPLGRRWNKSFSSTNDRLMETVAHLPGNDIVSKVHGHSSTEKEPASDITACSRDNIFSVLQIETATAKAVLDKPLGDGFSPATKSTVSSAVSQERMSVMSSFPFGSVPYSRASSFKDESISFGPFRRQSNAPFSCSSVYANLTPAPQPPGPVCKWTPEDVVAFVQSTPGCSAYASAFLSNEIDGEALLLLAKDQFIQPPIGMKIGPALKLAARLESIRHLN